MRPRHPRAARLRAGRLPAGLILAAGALLTSSCHPGDDPDPTVPGRPSLRYQPKMTLDSSGFAILAPYLRRWAPDASLEDVAASWRQVGYRNIALVDRLLAATMVAK